MSSFWLTKKMLLEALKLSEGKPQETCIMFKGDSERKGDKTYAVMEISVVGGDKKTVKQEFKPIEL